MNHSSFSPPRGAAASNVSLVALAVILSLSNSSIARAQNSSDSDTTQSDMLEQVVVTATKRQANVEDVPISITALSSGDIVRNRILSMEDVTRQVPGFAILNNNSNENYLSIRGAALFDDSSGTDQGVSLFVDGVVRTGVADMNPDLYDIDRIEVLKGPQGTLFGRNATGGVVSIFTKDPTFRPEVQGEATYGNHNLTEIKGVVNVPLVDKLLAMRVVATTHWQDGWARDVTLGRDIASQNRQSLRGKLLFTPTDDLRAVLGFDYFHQHDSSAKFVLGSFQPALDPIVSSPEVTANKEPGHDFNSSWGATATVDWSTDHGTLTSVTGWRHVDAHDMQSVTADPLQTINQLNRAADRQFTEELRFASSTKGRFNWIGGVYFLDSWKSRPIDFLFTIFPGSFFDSIGLGPVIPSMVRQNTTTRSWAPFGEASYQIADGLKLTVGGRYTREEKTGFSLINPSGTVAGSLIEASYTGSWSAFTPKFTLSYQPVRELLTYATVSKGFQGGGFNTQGSTQEALSTPFNPEVVWNYEAGFKFDGLHHRLQTNVSGFVDRYSQLQLISFNGATASSETTNAGKSEIKGVEADIEALPVKWLNVGVKYAYYDAKFTSYLIDNGPGVPPTDYTGNEIPYVPKQSVTVSGEFHFDAPRLQGSIDVGGDYTYRSIMHLDAANDIAAFLIDRTAWRGMLNAHASWTDYNDHWSVVLWGTNLRNIFYTPLTSDVAAFVSTPAEFANPDNHLYMFRSNSPRSFGVTVQAKF